MAREILLYRADTLPEAWLLRTTLADHGIAARVSGEALIGLAGAIPVRDAQPAVWVAASDEDRARAVLQRFEGPELVHPAQTCPACGEDNPAGFAVCWNCEASLAG